MKDHLKEAGESYWTHGYFAWKWGLFLIFTGIISMLHGLFPFLWPFEAPRRVMIVAQVVKKKHPEIYKLSVLFAIGSLSLSQAILRTSYTELGV